MLRRGRQAAIPELTTGLLVVLGLLGILGPFGTDAFVPALPEMARALHSSPSGLQFAMGVFGLGMALGQIIIGPLSDRHGRRLFLLGGTIVCAAGAFFGSFVVDLSGLIAACFVMGIGGSVSVVIVWSIVADLSTYKESARGLAIVDMMVSLGPILGPIAAVLIMGVAGWRGIFVGIGLYAAVMALIVVLVVPESLALAQRVITPLRDAFADYGRVLNNRNFLLRFGTLLCSFGILFAYIGASPFIFIDRLGVSLGVYSLIFAANGVGIVIGSIATTQLTRYFSLQKIVGTGVVLQFVSAVVISALVVTDSLNVWNLAIVLFVLIGSFGLIFGSGTALAIEEVRQHSGSALAVLGSSQFLIGGIVLFLTGLGESTASMSVLIVALAAISAVCFARAAKSKTAT